MQLYDLNISWIPWLEAILLTVLLLIGAIQPHTVSLCVRTLASPIQRRYAIGENNPVLGALRLVFQLGVVSLALIMATMAYMGYAPAIAPLAYGKVVGIAGVVVGVKALVDRWIQLTFRYAIKEKIYYSFRSDLLMLMSLVLLIVLILSPAFSVWAKWLSPLVVMGLYFLILWWKLMQVFGWSVAHIVYTMLYILHVEILPVLVVIEGIRVVFGVKS